MARYGTPQRRPIAAPAPSPEKKRATLTARITPEALEKAHQMAGALNVSLSALVLEMLERAEVDENGHPGWNSRYAPTEDAEQLELSA